MARARRVAAVACLGVLGVACGYGVGMVTEAPIEAPHGQAGPLTALRRQTTPPPATRTVTPVPDNSPALDPAEITFRQQTFESEGTLHSSVSLQVPKDWWRRSDPRPDRKQFSSSDRRRWMRVDAGFPLDRPTTDSRAFRITQLRGARPPYANLQIEPDQPAGEVTGPDGRVRHHRTLVYRYVPEERTLLVIVRWIGFGADPRTAVELSVTGLPKDRKALERIIDRATRTVSRIDR